MDDPMVRSRLGRANGTRPLEALDPKRGPPFFFWRDFRFEISTPLRKFHERMPEDTICGTLPRMSPYCVLGIAIGIGVVAGLRSFTAPAVVCWGAYLGWLNLQDSRLAFLGTIAAVAVATLLAIGELVMDKLPSTPSRTTAVPLVSRLVMGSLCGAAIGITAGQSVLLSVVLGAVGALIGTFGGYQIRHRLVAGLKVKDIVIALLEDVVAIGGAFLLVSRF
jgi:uncharacterized membrane protein